MTCGNGRKAKRRRLINFDSGGDAVACIGDLTELVSCPQGPCPPSTFYRNTYKGRGGGERRDLVKTERQKFHSKKS